MINGQDIIIDLSAILEQVNNLAGIIAALIGGACALKGIGYLELLRQKKAVATFSFESQLYARLYELKIIINSNERMFTNLYSEIAREEWGDKRGASEKELKKFDVPELDPLGKEIIECFKRGGTVEDYCNLTPM